ncbi:MAG: hypothetical protein PVF73_01400 [Bacteroidales bacterium]|jgi:hypothetical protein
MKKFGLILLIVIASCQKEDEIISKTRDDFSGVYCGELISTRGSWRPVHVVVSKSDTDSAAIIFEDFFNGRDVEAIVDGYHLHIPEQAFRFSNHNGPFGGTFYYTLYLSGNGSLDIDTHYMQIHFICKEISEDTQEKISLSKAELYDPDYYSCTGTYTGDSVTVVVTSVNDSLFTSITFQCDDIPKGWKNIKTRDETCYLNFLADSINDIASGEVYRLSGSGLKVGNRIEFSIRAYYHGVSPLLFYDFSVTKTD